MDTFQFRLRSGENSAYITCRINTRFCACVHNSLNICWRAKCFRFKAVTKMNHIFYAKLSFLSKPYGFRDKYRVAQKLVSLKYSLLLTGMFIFKPTSQFVERYHSVVHWKWRILFRTVFVNSVSLRNF
jgi:hypothetical protein